MVRRNQRTGQHVHGGTPMPVSLGGYGEWMAGDLGNDHSGNAQPVWGIAPPEPMITPEELRAISLELWQSEQYAAIAPAFFAINDRRMYEIRRQPSLAHDFGDIPNYLGRLIPRAARDPAVIERGVRGRWDELRLPYMLEMQWGGQHNEVLECHAGALVRQRLHDWVTDPRYSWNSHTLHGAVGRALDVLRVAAGAVAANHVDTTNRVATGAYIPYAAFLDMLKDSCLSYDLKKELPARVEWSLVHQLQKGLPVARAVLAGELEGATPEIIIEGNVSMSERGDAAGRYVAIDLIAVNSLKGLAYRKKCSPQLMDFLRQLSREAEDQTVYITE